MIRRSLTALAARLLPLLGRERWTDGRLARDAEEWASLLRHGPSAPGEIVHLAEGQRLPALSAIAAIEAQDFVAADTPSTFDRFGLLALALDGAVARDRTALEALAQIEAQPREGGRPQGLEWAYAELFAHADRLQQVASLLRQLMPHEATVRALVAGGEVRS